MNRGFLCVAFMLVCIVQLAVPFSIVVQHALAREYGTEVRMRLQAFDPYDAFRGRYVVLNLEGSLAPVKAGQSFALGEQVYAVLATDNEGFSRIESVVKEKPVEGLYLPATAQYTLRATANREGGLRLDLPIDRFYMEETKAPEAEAVLRDAMGRGGEPDVYVVFHLLNGAVSIDDVYVDGLSLVTQVDQRRSQQSVAGGE